jgi:uncharacterized protein (DUF1810 family)
MLFEDPNDPFTLSRFVQGQARNYETALQELKDGKKRSHWMWYVFPQFKGLGSSAASARFAIRSLEEAQAYLAHPVLGERLKECAEVVLQLEGKTTEQIFGCPDYMKFRSCMTLFAEASEADSVFQKTLEKYHDGHGDPATLALISAG